MGRGQLIFKGEDGHKGSSVKSKKKRTKAKYDKPNVSLDAAATITPTTTQPYVKAALHVAAAAPQQPAAAAPAPPQVQTGTGMITTSGTVVMGHDTRFQRELSVGDAVLVGSEMRVVTMCLSDTSLNLSSAFSQSFATPVSFSYIRKPSAQRDRAAAGQQQQQQQPETIAEGQQASGLSASNELVYRERTEHGSYRIKRLKLQGEVSRTELLDLRSKKKGDKYC